MAAQSPVTETPVDLAKLVRILRWVSAALLLSQVVFLAIAVALRESGTMPIVGDPLLFVGIGSFLTASTIAIALVFNSLLVRTQEGTGDTFTRIRRISGLVMVRIAILEAGAMVNIVFYLLSGHWLLLADVGLIFAAFVVFLPAPALFASSSGPGIPPPIS